MRKAITVEMDLMSKLNTTDNNLRVTNVLIDKMVENKVLNSCDSPTANYVRDYFKQADLVLLLGIDAIDAFTYVKTAMISKFLEKYSELQEEKFSNNDDWVTASCWFDKFDLDEMYDMCFVNEVAYATKYEEYIKKNLPNMLPNYEFDVDVDFKVVGDYDIDKIKDKVKHRIMHHWKACELQSIVVFTSSVTEGFKGQFRIHINGNATYTMDTIKKAISNRLGADAKWRKWEDITIVSVS